VAALRVQKAHIRQEASRYFRRLFPERQIFLRSRGEVRFIKLSPGFQATAACGLLLLFGWVLAVSTAYLTRDSRLAAKERQLHFVSEELDSLVGELERLQREALGRAEQLERRQRLLESLMDVPPAELAQSAPAKEPAAGEAAPATGGAVPLSPQSAREPVLSSPVLLATALGSANTEVLQPMPSRQVRRAVDALGRRLEQVAAVQEQAASTLAEAQAEHLVEIRSVLESLGLHPAQLLARARATPTGVGGPAIELEPPVSSPAFALLENRLHERSLMTQALHSVPSVAPAKNYYISSRFGPRRDPFTKRWARHSGLDMAGWRGEPILAAAAGKVVKAGRVPAYGRMVEIDHGFGIRTRYGHMRKVLVDNGQTVVRGQPIGEMGNSGRSTSTHLHWEVWVDGELVDPLPYLKAVNDVYALQGRSEKVGP